MPEVEPLLILPISTPILPSAVVIEEIKEQPKISLNQTHLASKIALGKAKWDSSFGIADKEPLLPAYIDQLISKPCPIFKDGRTIGETHIMVMMTKTVNDAPHSINSFGKRIPHPQKNQLDDPFWKSMYEQNSGYESLTPNVKSQLGDAGIEESYWLFMTRDVVPGTAGIAHEKQKHLIAELAKESEIEYRPCTALEATTCIYMDLAHEKKTIFSTQKVAWTECLDTVRFTTQEGFDVEVPVWAGKDAHPYFSGINNPYYLGSDAARCGMVAMFRV